MQRSCTKVAVSCPQLSTTELELLFCFTLPFYGSQKVIAFYDLMNHNLFLAAGLVEKRRLWWCIHMEPGLGRFQWSMRRSKISAIEYHCTKFEISNWRVYLTDNPKYCYWKIIYLIAPLVNVMGDLIFYLIKIGHASSLQVFK